MVIRNDKELQIHEIDPLCVCFSPRKQMCILDTRARRERKPVWAGAGLESRPVLPCSHSLLCPHGP